LSSKGRTSGFDPENLGSNPSEAAKIILWGKVCLKSSFNIQKFAAFQK
jgi:hypothetical protein